MKKTSDKKKDFKLTHNLDDLEDFLGGIEDPEEDNKPDDASIKLEFVAKDGASITFLHPQQGRTVSPGFVIAHSSETVDFITADNFFNQDFHNFQPLIALPGSRLASKKESEIIFDIDSEKPLTNDGKIDTLQLKRGKYIATNDSGEYIAEQFGFVLLINETLSIMSPLYLRQDKLGIDWLLPADLPTGITRQMIEFWLYEEGIKSVPDESLDALLQAIQEGSYEPGHYTIISGTPPEHGENGTIEWQVDVALSPGKEFPDGKIDFRERNYVVNVTAGQLLGVLKPPTQGKPGENIFGSPLPANNGISLHIEDGDYVRKENSEEGILFFAETGGAFHFDNHTVFITEVLILPEGVNYKTGNISFGGDVVVEGDVESGFSVRAGGNIIVTNSVEDGSTLEALGKITVGSFINGDRVLVKAGLSVHAQYVNEATIKAGQDIILASYARHAKLRAQRLIQVKKTYGKLGGSIVGGVAWAAQKIDVHIAGTEAWILTELVAGISPEQAEKLDKVLASIESKSHHIRQILAHFGLLDIDQEKLKSMIESAQGVQRKSLALRAKYLVQAGRQLQLLLAEKLKIVTEMGPAPENAEVIIREKAHPNTIISISKNKRKLDHVIGNTRFYLQNDVLISN